MSGNLPKRVALRLPKHDYSAPGYYFVTVCAEGKHCILRKGAQPAPAELLPELSEAGMLAERFLNEIPKHYPTVTVDKYVVMPNHIHAILVFKEADAQCAPLQKPTLSSVVRAWKVTVTKTLGEAIWQKGFYEHIIRNEANYLRIWQYIDDNPAKWADDEYYPG